MEAFARLKSGMAQAATRAKCKPSARLVTRQRMEEPGP